MGRRVGAEFELDANAGYTSRRMCIMPQHYTAQMHALGCTTWDVSGDQPLNIVNKLGTSRAWEPGFLAGFQGRYPASAISVAITP